MRALLEHARHDPDRIERAKALEPDRAAINAAAELIIKSLLIGIDNAVSGNRFADETEDIAELPFYEAVEYLRKKDVLPAKKYYELSDKARFRAFTLSRIADGDVMQRVKDMLAQNVSEGGGLGEFLKKTDEEIMQGCGLGGSGGGWYWENVYRTNVQTAYNAGRAIGYEAAPPIALELVGINDARQTAVCRRLTQPPVRRLYTDEFWRTHWPPFHFGCRTTVRAIYDAQELEEHPVTGVPDGEEPAKGFGRYPVTSGSWWRELKSMAARAAAYNIQTEISNAYKTLIEQGFKTNRSVGAMAQRFYVDSEFKVKSIDDNYPPLYIKEGTEVTGVKVIAEGTGIRDVNRLIQEYPLENGKLTSAKDWYKVRGTAIIIDSETKKEFKAEIHWYQCKNIGKVEMKIKRRYP